MGIHQLMQFLKEKAPNCFRTLMLDYFAGRTIGCDASMAMYQFLIQTQSAGQTQIIELTDKDGNRTGHLVGLFNRTLQFLENGIKPVWVFDGKPPLLKSGELARRKKLKEEAQVKTELALEQGDMQQALLQHQRTTTISSVMKEDAIKMLQLMGCPVIIAPCEAEAQCAELCRAGKIYATATEDMDALTFRTPVLLRGFNTKKEPIYEIIYDDMMKELDITYEQFVDLCILCGCDYTEKIEGIGPGTAFKLIKEFKNIEGILEHVQKVNAEREKNKQNPKYTVPTKFLYQDSRELFITPLVQKGDEIQLTWNKPDVENLKKFLIEEKGFAESRIDNGLKRIAKKDTTGFQSRLENFFGKTTKIIHPNNSKAKGKPNKKNEPTQKSGGKKKM
ncbi:unnamed protein product [Paramecium octaurelia]|uniref:Flap endonuclease 1 n=1 Tax=Paramecium octaurelia TaxID=43137 RepID=A0A8S1TSX7_PAROT|nr:unnamed protein product [Paramecium octaurelia]